MKLDIKITRQGSKRRAEQGPMEKAIAVSANGAFPMTMDGFLGCARNDVLILRADFMRALTGAERPFLVDSLPGPLDVMCDRSRSVLCFLR